jgi:membrane protease YdiL (CAAX protease family)
MAELQPDLTGAPYAGAPVTYAEAMAAGVELRPSRWGAPDVAIALLLSIVAPVLLVGGLLAAGLSSHGPLVLLASFTTPWIGFALWPWCTARFNGNGVRIDLGYTFRLNDLLWGAAGALVALVLGNAVAALTQMFFGDFGSAAGDAIASAEVPGFVYALLICCAVIGAPLAEELCFRGLAFAVIARWASRRGLPAVPWATVVSAALFAAIHLEPVRFPVLLAIGLVLSWLRAATGRVGASVVAHALNNVLAFII